jgi:hypothetical protein
MFGSVRYLVGESDEESVRIASHASTRSSNAILAGDNMTSLYQQWDPSERCRDFMRSLPFVRRKIKVIIVRLRQQRTVDVRVLEHQQYKTPQLQRPSSQQDEPKSPCHQGKPDPPS